MIEPKAISPTASPLAAPGVLESQAQKRDSLFARRVIGGTFIAALVLLGLAFPMII